MRCHCLTRKVKTPMGSVFINLDINAEGHVSRLSLAQAQKFEDTAVGRLLDEIANGANALLDEFNGAEGDLSIE